METTQGAMSSPFQTDNQQYPTSGAMGGMLPPSFPQGLQNLDIPPDVAQILQQIPNLQPGMAPGQPGQMQGNEMPSANATIKNVQNLLSSIMVRRVEGRDSILGVQESYTAYFPKGLSNMQFKLPNRVLFKISGTPTNVRCFSL